VQCSALCSALYSMQYAGHSLSLFILEVNDIPSCVSSFCIVPAESGVSSETPFVSAVLSTDCGGVGDLAFILKLTKACVVVFTFYL
jgi:hypothetical protein